MKGKLPLILLALALVAAVGWLALPRDQKPAPVAGGSAQPVSRSDRPSKASPRPPSPTDRAPRSGNSTIAPEAVAGMMRGQRLRSDQEIAKLVLRFDLSEEQEALLRDWYEGQLANLEEQLRSSGGLSAIDLQALSANMRSVGLDQFLDGLLDDDQRTDLERTSQRNRHARVEAHVVKELRELKDSLGLTPPQTRALRSLIYENATERYERLSTEAPFRSLVSNGRGVDLEEVGIDLGSVAVAGGGGSSFESLSTEERLELLRTARADYIAGVVEQYGRILNPEQQEAYRISLENETAEILENALKENSLPDRNPSELPLIRGIKRK